MGVATKTGSGLVSVGLLMGVVGLAGLILHDRQPAQGPDSDTTDRLTVTLSFDPSPRVNYPVHVTVTVEGVRTIDEEVSQSGWTRTHSIPAGAKVWATATQGKSGLLRCIILINDVQRDSESRDGSGSVTCGN